MPLADPVTTAVRFVLIERAYRGRLVPFLGVEQDEP